MADVIELLKGHGATAAAFLSSALGAVLTFSRLVDVPLDVRFTLVAVFDLTMATFVIVALTPPLVRRIKGFNAQPAKPRFSWPAMVVKVLLILSICAAAVALLRLTVTYHNMLLRQTTNEGDARAGTIELEPSHFSTSVTIILSTPQPDVQILELDPQGCGAAPIDTPNIQDPTDFSATIHLHDFRTPQKFCLPYHLSGRAELLNAAASATVSNIEILRDGRTRTYQRHVWFFGGALCVFASLLFCYRYSWFRGQPN